MTVCEGAQGFMYNNYHFIYMIKRSFIQCVHDLILIYGQQIRLMPGRYVGIEEEEDDGVPFEEKMEKFTSDFLIQLNKSNELDRQIKKNLHFLDFID